MWNNYYGNNLSLGVFKCNSLKFWCFDPHSRNDRCLFDLNGVAKFFMYKAITRT